MLRFGYKIDYVNTGPLGILSGERYIRVIVFTGKPGRNNLIVCSFDLLIAALGARDSEFGHAGNSNRRLVRLTDSSLVMRTVARLGHIVRCDR